MKEDLDSCRLYGLASRGGSGSGQEKEPANGEERHESECDEGRDIIQRIPK